MAGCMTPQVPGTPTRDNPQGEVTVSSKNTSGGLLSKINEKRVELGRILTRTQSEIADLEKQAKWAAGQERRDRLTAYAEEARQLADQADDVTAGIAAAAQKVSAAVQALEVLIADHNAKLDEIVQKVKAEGIRDSYTPPSPVDGSVGVVRSSLIIGMRHVEPLDRDTAVRVAVEAATDPDAVAKLPKAVVQRELWAGPYFRSRTSGSVIAGDHNPNPQDCDEISRAEYLAANWGIGLTELPDELLAELADIDRARVAGRLLEELDDDARSKFAEQLIPRKETTK